MTEERVMDAKMMMIALTTMEMMAKAQIYGDNLLKKMDTIIESKKCAAANAIMIMRLFSCCVLMLIMLKNVLVFFLYEEKKKFCFFH